jgi:hypothetical protein
MLIAEVLTNIVKNEFARESIRFSEWVTLNGECISIAYDRAENDSHRLGALYLFEIKDAIQNRGQRLLQLYHARRFAKDAIDFQIQYTVGINVIRRAFDSGELNFDTPFDELQYKELKIQNSDFEPHSKVTDPELMQYIMHKAYWLGYKLNSHVGLYTPQFEHPTDYDYLGVEHSDIKRIVWLLTQRHLLGGKGRDRDTPHVTEKLVSLYESSHGTKLAKEYVFPEGTQWEAYKAVKQILQLAKLEVFIVDNYMSDDVLDMVAALSPKIKVRLLTSKVDADFKVAVSRFRSQYAQHELEVRRHSAEIHDRTISIDNAQWYALGHSLKGLGGKLSLINKLEDVNAIQILRNTLEKVWIAAAVIV